MQSLNAMLKRTASSCLTPLALQAAKSYIAGPDLADALRVAARLAEGGFRTTLGFWDGPGDSPVSVAQEYLRAIAALASDEDDSQILTGSVVARRVSEGRRGAAFAYASDYPAHTMGTAVCQMNDPEDCYLSIKLPALGDSGDLLNQVLAQTAVRIHFDSLAPEGADTTWSAALAAAEAGNIISCSLPGRWRRSIADAEAAIEAGIIPRVVKGQWPDSDGRDLDMRAGFMSVVHRLAGRAPHVAVASHDVPLAREAIEQLRAAGTSCELELLYGLPERAAVALARREGVPVRFYVPYGKAYLPYCLGQIRRRPRMLWWLLRDALLHA